MARHGRIVAGAALLLAAAAAFVLPDWIISLATIAFANGLVVLGLIVLWRAGLVSFGQALYYCIGAYAVALTGHAVAPSLFAVMLALGHERVVRRLQSASSITAPVQSAEAPQPA